jgi:hypothetical protein
VSPLAGAMPAWGWIAVAVFGIAMLLAGMWTGYERGHGHAEEEARWAEQDQRWQRAQDAAARPVPVRPPEQDVMFGYGADRKPAGPGKHRHPGGPARHADLPKAGYLAAPDGGSPWSGTITMPAPAQAPPWDFRPPQPEPPPEPTAVLPGPPETDTEWTRRNVAELQAFMDGLMEQSESYLKEITR